MRLKGIYLASGAAAAMALSAGAASADPLGWYGAIDAGWHKADASAWDFDGTGSEYEFELAEDWAAFGRLGYRFDQNWRVELEGGYRGADIETVDKLGGGLPTGICQPSPAGACEGPDGTIDAATLMVNVIYDFGDDSWGIRPFVGLGAGVARINTDFIGTQEGQRGFTIAADDSSAKLAAQALAGVSMALGERLDLDLTYRYLMTDFEFDSIASGPVNFGNFEGPYEDHSLTLGLRWAFGAEPVVVPPPLPPVVPPPPVVRPPAPVPPTPPQPPRPAPRQFVVYFEWDSTALSADANNVIAQAAQYAASGRPTSILVVGHADTSGSAQYNEGLAMRRSRTVADALVARGVNSGVLRVDGRGERELARPTADGVREPLNRRATIDINF
ncbi:OmpA family protein [Brevundimonas fluminis]|jgi:OOP family OmpA-OmpF porin|uniref:OmpA family protein n=1 Tax=Brevundimonas fluminis TaxID=2487274 RepID=UPI000F656E64|nr:outer membrane beta-barrel protein [Brevundimonas fluminis]